MKDDNGRVLIRDFYAGVEPLTTTEQQAVRDVPPAEGELTRTTTNHSSNENLRLQNLWDELDTMATLLQM